MRRIVFTFASILLISSVTKAEEQNFIKVPEMDAEQAKATVMAVLQDQEIGMRSLVEESGDLSQKLAWELDKSSVAGDLLSATFDFQTSETENNKFSLGLIPSAKSIVLRREDVNRGPIDGGINLPLNFDTRTKADYSMGNGIAIQVFLPKKSGENFSLLLCPRRSGKADPSIELVGMSSLVSGKILGTSPVGFGVSEMHASIKTTANTAKGTNVADFDKGKLASVRLRYDPDAEATVERSADLNAVGVLSDYRSKNPAGYVRNEKKQDLIRVAKVEVKGTAEETAGLENGICYLLQREKVRSNFYIKEDPISVD